MSKRNPGERPARDPLYRRFRTWIHTSGAKCSLILFICSLLMFTMYFACSVPVQYSLTAGTVSRYTIVATKDVVDEVTTEEKRNAAALAVEPTYRLEEGASEQVLTELANIFSELRTIQQYGLTLRDPNETGMALRTHNYPDAEIEYAQSLITTLTLTRYQITTLLRTETDDFDIMVSTVTTAVENSLNTTIREGQVAQAISTISQIVGYKVETSLFQNILPSVLKSCIHPNMVIDAESTALAQEQARESVEPVSYLQGQTIVIEGQRVTKAQVAVLRTLGLLYNDVIDLSVYIGGAILTVFVMLVLVFMLRLFTPDLLHDIRRTLVVSSVMLVTTLLCVLSVRVLDIYLAPTALAAILLSVLIGWQAGIAGVVSMTLMMIALIAGSSASSSNVSIVSTLTGLIGGIISVLILQSKPRRLRVLVCGLIISAVGVITQIALSLTSSAASLEEIITPCLWMISGGVFTGVAAIGLQPLFESVFNLSTPTKLMELGNQNHPLLRRLMLEAPGTYHHSMIVANLAEAAAQKIGANPYLARTGSYFHDIGKLKRPMYFKENQLGEENPLDQNDPYVSAAIITSHTKDGLQLAQKYHLPKEIQQIIVEHHGDTPVMFFYHKALQMADGKPVDITDFRYDGTRPATREAAIVMLADTIEAAVRSMKNPTPEDIEQNIERLIRGKLEDGQLSNSPLSLRDIDGICEAFSTVLKGVFHERIEYPKETLAHRGMLKQQEPTSSTESKSAAEAAAPVQAARPAAQPRPAEITPPPSSATGANQAVDNTVASVGEEPAVIPAAVNPSDESDTIQAEPATVPEQKEEGM